MHHSRLRPSSTSHRSFSAIIETQLLNQKPVNGMRPPKHEQVHSETKGITRLQRLACSPLSTTRACCPSTSNHTANQITSNSIFHNVLQYPQHVRNNPILPLERRGVAIRNLALPPHQDSALSSWIAIAIDFRPAQEGQDDRLSRRRDGQEAESRWRTRFSLCQLASLTPR